MHIGLIYKIMSLNAPLHYNESRLYCNIWKFVEKTVSRVLWL